MIDQDNKIFVFKKGKNEWILEFPQYNIETLAYIGKNGVTSEKREGDEKTPIGEFKLGVIMGMHPKEEIENGTKLEYIQITKDMYWVDDSKSKYYNQLVKISEVEKDWKSAEHLIDYPIQYEYLIEVKTNPKNIPGNGSAIFLHCTNNKSTAGCIAIDKKIMEKLIEVIDKNTTIEINR